MFKIFMCSKFSNKTFDIFPFLEWKLLSILSWWGVDIRGMWNLKEINGNILFKCRVGIDISCALKRWRESNTQTWLHTKTSHQSLNIQLPLAPLFMDESLRFPTEMFYSPCTLRILHAMCANIQEFGTNPSKS